MITVNTHAAKTRLSKLLAAVEKKNEVVVICRAGRPVAELRAVTSGKRNPLERNAKLAKVVFHEDPARPLEPEDWPEEP